ncbi:hypothetical protein GGH19_002353 [Coemansia sp. RSA 1807]|nr:hypothetical protein LPJ54_002296 [Coemansia sp. RSA 1824]KAJ2576240.1 hypothetical protein GGH19_002353 [Coemansia sp. RSA 1807]
MDRRVLTLGCALALFGLWLLVSAGDNWLDRSHSSPERRAFEHRWWNAFRRMSYAHNSTFTLLPDNVQQSAAALLKPGSEFHDSIAGLYHGQWNAVHFTPHHNDTIGQWNTTLPEGYERPANASTGDLEMTLDAEPSIDDSVSLISGDVHLRSGGFNTRLILQGLHWHTNGTAVLHAVPELSAQTTVDVVRAMSTSRAFDQARGIYDETLGGRLLSYTRPEEALDGCSYHIYMHFGTAPSGVQAQALTVSSNCNVLLATPSGQHVSGVSHARYRQKTTRYFRTGLALMLAQAALLFLQMRATTTHAAMSMVSHHTLAMLAVLYTYIFIMHSIACLAFGGIYLIFGFVTIAAYLLSMSLYLKYLICVWKVQSPDAFDALNAAGRRGLLTVYVKFYAVLIPGVYTIYAFIDTRSRLSQWLMAILLTAMYSYWLPQIWLNVRRGVARRLRIDYIVGSSIVHLFLPVYFFACPENIAFIRPTPLIWVLVAYNLSQAAVLVLQRFLGALFFIPAVLRPDVYSYCASLPSVDEESCVGADQQTESMHKCPICLMPVDATSSSESAHAVTPCHHVYHEACLANWMEIKLECPVCRAALPPRVDG